jgi:flagellar motor switch protein FliG
MPEPNGEIPLTGDSRVDAAIARIRGKFRDLEDALTVQAHLEKKAGERIKEHAEWLARHDKELEERKTREQDLDNRIRDMVFAIGDLIGRIPPDSLH